EIHLIHNRISADKINPPAIRRPDGEMVVSTGAAHEDLAGSVAGTICHEHRVAWIRCVINHAGAVGGPSHSHRPGAQKSPGLAAPQRHDQGLERPAVLDEPDFGTVA